MTPEAFDPETSRWVPIGNAAGYDSDLQSLFFDLQLDPALSAASGAGLRDGTEIPLQAGPSHEKRVRVRARKYTSLRSAYRQGSSFQVYYYPPTGGSDAVLDDLTWDSRTGNASDPDIPDSIEDLDIALNDAYARLLTFTDPSGTRVFSPESAPMSACVEDLGPGIEGQTKLGGGWFCDLYISNQQLRTWDQMRGVAGHELVHVLQGQHYSSNLHAWVYNQWFVEAAANHYSARAVQLSDAERMEL